MNEADELIEQLRTRMGADDIVWIFRAELEAIIVDRVRLKRGDAEMIVGAVNEISAKFMRDGITQKTKKTMEEIAMDIAERTIVDQGREIAKLRIEIGELKAYQGGTQAGADSLRKEINSLSSEYNTLWAELDNLRKENRALRGHPVEETPE